MTAVIHGCSLQYLVVVNGGLQLFGELKTAVFGGSRRTAVFSVLTTAVFYGSKKTAVIF